MTNIIKALQRNFSATGVVPKIASALFILLFTSTISTVSQSYDYEPGTPAYMDLHGFARNYTIAMLAIVAFLAILQRDYFFSFKKDGPGKLDERQISKRKRIMERSYYFTILILGISLYVLIGNKTAIVDKLQHAAANDWIWALIPFNLLMLIIALPLIMATWRKDTRLETATAVTKFSFKKFLIFVWVPVILLFVLQFILTEINNLTSLTIDQPFFLSVLPFLCFSLASMMTLIAAVAALLRWLMGKD